MEVIDNDVQIIVSITSIMSHAAFPVWNKIDREWSGRGSCCSYFKNATHAS